MTIQKSAIWCFHLMSSNLRASPVKTLKRSDTFGLQILLQLGANSADTETSRSSRNTKDSGQSQLVTLLKAHVQNDFKTCRSRVFADKNARRICKPFMIIRPYLSIQKRVKSRPNNRLLIQSKRTSTRFRKLTCFTLVCGQSLKVWRGNILKLTLSQQHSATVRT